MTRLIHRFWGGRPMPEEFASYGQTWRRLNPDWVVHDWTYEQLPDLRCAAVVDDLFSRASDPLSEALWVQVADVVGYELLARYGGVYVNCDICPVRPLTALLNAVNNRAWVTREDDYWVTDAAIGAPGPREPFWEVVLACLPESYWAKRDAEMVVSTGPQFLTPLAYDAAEGGKLVILPAETFNPIHYLSVPEFNPKPLSYSISALPENTIGVHQWAHRRTMRPNVVT